MTAFTRLIIDLDGAPSFEALLAAVPMADVTRGRAGNHLTRPCAEGVPIVRTTTGYPQPQGLFTAAHEDLIGRIQRAAAAEGLPELRFNHALIEVYDQRYRKMGYHCDQALDLAEGSFIALLSLYDRDLAGASAGERQLMVKHKETGARRQLPMPHGSVVLFSVEANAQHLHKIVLPSAAPEPVRWLGLTLRCAKTFVRHSGGAATFADGAPLTLADADERARFLRLRAQENRAVDFRYPPLPFTLSEGDLLPPAGDAAA